MRATKKVCLIAACIALSYGIAWAETLDKIVANVNGEIILYSEVKQHVQMLQKITPQAKTDDPARQSEIERDVLQQLVRERLTQEEVKRLKISVSKQEVDAAVEGIKAENKLTDAQMEQVLKQEGQTTEQFRDGIKKQLERNRLLDRVLKSKVVITEEQIDAYLKSGKAAAAGGKELRRIGVIHIPSSAGGGVRQSQSAEKLAQEIYGRLKDGADFGQMAKEHSKGPAAEEGGDIGFIALDDLAPPIEEAVRGLKPTEMTNVVKSTDGYYIVKVIDIKKEMQSTAGGNDGKTRERARRELFQQEVNRKFEEWVRNLESKAFIQINL